MDRKRRRNVMGLVGCWAVALGCAGLPACLYRLEPLVLEEELGYMDMGWDTASLIRYELKEEMPLLLPRPNMMYTFDSAYFNILDSLPEMEP
jgi:hypothetical protein